MLWSLFNIHTLETNADSSRRDNDHSVSMLLQLDRRIHDQSQDRQEWLVSLLIDDGACA
jgi:hypothetical protein